MSESKRTIPGMWLGILIAAAFGIHRFANHSEAYLETVERHCGNNDFEGLSSFLPKPRKVFSSTEVSDLPVEYQVIAESKGMSATDAGYWFNLHTTPFRHLLIATDSEGNIRWWVIYRA